MPAFSSTSKLPENRGRANRSILIYAARHNDRVIKQKIFDIYENLLLRYVFLFHRRFPEVDIDDLKQNACERLLICISKFNPKQDTFSFIKYLKAALYFSLRRYAEKNFSHVSVTEKQFVRDFVGREPDITGGLDESYYAMQHSLHLENVKNRISEVPKSLIQKAKAELKKIITRRLNKCQKQQPENTKG